MEWEESGVYGERFRVPLKKSILNYNPILNKYKTYKMNLKQDRIEEIVRNGYQFFADVLIKHLKTIKNSPYAGLMIFVFIVILFCSVRL
jgi:hypothetical protein